MAVYKATRKEVKPEDVKPEAKAKPKAKAKV